MADRTEAQGTARASGVSQAGGPAPHAAPIHDARHVAPPGDFDGDTGVRRLTTDVRETPTHELTFAAEISPAWHAARGPHGGYIAAILQRALTEAAADPARAPRSLTVHYARPPKPGPVLIRTALEREGRSLSTLSARMEQDGSLVALALSAFSVPWSAPEVSGLPMPSVAGPDPVRETPRSLIERIEQGLAPPFLSQLVIQQRAGAVPFSGLDAPMEVSAWLGVSDPARPLDAIALALFSDVGIPPPFIRLHEPAMSSTIDLTIHFRTRLPRAGAHHPAELCFGRLRSSFIHEGFFEQDGVIWAPDGTLLAQSRQLAILMPLPGGKEG